MADSSVNLASPTGLADTRTTSTGDHRQVVAVGNDGDHVAMVERWGQLNVTQGPGTLFFDDFSTTLDTVDLWSVTGNAPGVTGGRLVPSATPSSYNYQRSMDVMPNGVGFTLVRAGVQLEAAAATGAGRFWGLGTVQAAPTATSLVTDGVGFEIDQASGALLAVTYAGGTRTTRATLTRPSDGELHRYSISHRVTHTYWFVDGEAVAVADQAFAPVTNADLPIAIVRQNAANFTGTPTFSVTGIFAADTNRDGTMLADAKVPARRARVALPYAGQVGNSLAVVPGKDINRTRVAITFQGAAPATADTLLTLSKFVNGVATTGTSIGVTPGKTLRLTSMVVGVRAGAAAAAFATATLRQNPAGATVIGSASELRVDVGVTGAVIGSAVSQDVTLGDGMDFHGAQTIGVSLAAQATTNVITVALLGYEY